MKKWIMSVMFLSGLAACGGGGGGGGGGGSNWLSFEPSEPSGTVYEGESLRMSVTGTAASMPTRPVYFGVVPDPAFFDVASVTVSDVFDPSQPGDVTERMRIVSGTTLPTLGVGAHDGEIEVRACMDDPQICDRRYGGPWHVPFHLQVDPNPGYPTSPLNGDFSDGMNHWTLMEWFDTPPVSVEDGVLYMDNSNGAGTALTHVQLTYEPGINLEQGKTYALRFDAHAGGDREIEVWVQENGRDVDGGGDAFTQYNWPDWEHIHTTNETHEMQFTMSNTNRTATIVFNIGGQVYQPGFWLDNVTVTEVAP
jgi:hypothetical protein